MMDRLAFIESRLNYWRNKLEKAEGRYHSAAQSISEQQRQGYLVECKVCRAVLAELELLREEVAEHGQKD